MIEKNILYRFVKRSVDIIGALVGCIMLIPLTLGIWIANIIAKDNGPVFYVQKRIGKNGKEFNAKLKLDNENKVVFDFNNIF